MWISNYPGSFPRTVRLPRDAAGQDWTAPDSKFSEITALPEFPDAAQQSYLRMVPGAESLFLSNRLITSHFKDIKIGILPRIIPHQFFSLAPKYLKDQCDSAFGNHTNRLSASNHYQFRPASHA